MATPGLQTLSTVTGSEMVTSIDAGGAVNAQTSTQAIANLFGASPSIMTFVTAAITGGATATVSSTVNFTAYQLTQTAAALTIRLPLTPVQGQRAGFTIDQIVTALLVQASTSSQTVVGQAALSASSASIGAYTWVYRAANTSWYRSV